MTTENRYIAENIFEILFNFEIGYHKEVIYLIPKEEEEYSCSCYSLIFEFINFEKRYMCTKLANTALKYLSNHMHDSLFINGILVEKLEGALNGQ